jgi:nicotinate phosphoribosyltransferase
MIIKSILDTDLYKFTTSYAYMKLFPQARGTFEFIDRDNTEYPEDFIERLYLELGVDPTTKTIVFSNALDFDKCQDIMEYCRGRIRCSFGIGTNDTGFKPANIVMKLTSCQMNSNQPIFGCVKLSDDAGKHTGKIEDVQRCLTDLGYAYRVP